MAETVQVLAQAGHPPVQGHATTEVAHDTRVEDSGSFPPFNSSTFASQLLWLAICFGLFYVLMARVVIPRLAAILDTRQDKITQDLADAAKLKAETDAAIAAYDKALAEARQKAGVIAAETRMQLTADVDAKRHAAEEKLSAKLAAAEADISAIKAKALAEVGGIARETATAVVAALSTASVSPDEIAHAVDTALTR